MSRYKKKRKSRARRIVGGFFRWLFLMLLAVILVGGFIAALQVKRIIADAPALDPVMVSPTAAATYICDSDGSRLQKLTLPEANRDLVTLDRIPKDLQYAFIAIEDARYYKHNGIDLLGILRAGLKGITTGSFNEGASTITQQLLKNSIFTDWTSESGFRQRLVRKIQEQYLALQLEKLLTKDQILEDYLNTINLGAGCYGVQAAAFKYFGKDVADLTLSECAVIAGITQNPTRYNPLTNPEANRARRKAVLDRMLQEHYISQPRYDEALADDVYSRIQSNVALESEQSSIYTWYQDALIDQVLSDLMDEKGYTYKQAYKAVYTGGLRIYSAQDKDMQAICDEEFANAANFPQAVGFGLDYALSIQHADGEVIHYGNDSLRSFVRTSSDPDFDLVFASRDAASQAAADFRAATVQEGDTVLGERITITPQPQASLVIIDQSTGYVRALVGGRGDKEASLTLNRATYTTRQPGSTFKILTTYAPALDEAGKTLATTYRNGEFYYDDGTRVSNWDVSDYGDSATIREAIIRSINVVAVECITEITPKLGYAYAKAFGITTLTDHYETENGVLSDVIAPLALGGITKGVTALELCGAYACIANQGSYLKPTFYTRVTDHDGNVILDATAIPGKTVLKKSTAALLTDAMIDVVEDETGTAHQEIDMGYMPVAGKTGTTSDYRDIWFAGYTPYYTCCIWGGYDNNAVLPESDIGHTYVKVLWNSIMNCIHEDLTPVAFAGSSDIIRMNICRATGQAAAEKCPETYSELFALGTQPVAYCSVHGSGGLVAGFAGSGNTQQDGTSIFENEDITALTGQADIHDLTPSEPAGSITPSPGESTSSIAPSSGEQIGSSGLPSGDPNAIVIYSTDQASIPAAGDAGSGLQQSADSPADADDGQDTTHYTQNGQDQPANGSSQTDPGQQYTFNEAPEIVILN